MNLDIYQLLAMAAVSIFVWELLKAIVKLIWEEVRPARKKFYGPTHREMYEWSQALKKRNG